MKYKEDTYLADTHLIKNNPENTGLLPSDKWHSQQKRPINPLRTIFNNTFTPETLKKVGIDHKKGKVNIPYLEQHQKGIIEAYSNFYGEDWEQVLQAELDRSKDFLGTGVKDSGEKSIRSVHITLEQWEQYITNGGYEDHCFSCEARPDIIIFDFDYKLTEEQFQKIEKAFKKYLWVIERNIDKEPKDGKCKYGNSHIYIQSTDDTAITKVKAGLKANEDEEPLDIDIFKGGLKHVAGTTPSRKYKIIYDGEPTSRITPRKAINLLSKTLGCYLDKKILEDILQPRTHTQPTTTTTTTPEGEITVTSNNATDNQRYTTIIENAIPIFTKLAGIGIREELYKSLTGALLRHGINNANTLQIMTQIHNNTNDAPERLITVENAIKKYQASEEITGWRTFQNIVKAHNNSKVRLGGHLQRIADTLFINQPPLIQQLNPQTKTVETAVLLADNGEQNFTEYEETTETPENLYEIKNNYSDFQIIVDYENKTIAKRILKKDKKGNVTSEDTLIITAVPTHLEVYNDTICNAGKQYKCTWEYEDGTTTEVTGDIILHYKTLVKGGGVWNKNQLQNIISVVFGDLTKTKAHGTILKNTPLQKGFYYDKEADKIVVVDHEITRPTTKQLREALEILDIYGSYFGYMYYNPDGELGKDYQIGLDNKDKPVFKTDPDRLAVFLRWCLNAPFHYVRKQFGMTNDKYIFLSGESGAGKTYGYIIAGLFMLGIDNPKDSDYIVSGASNSKAQISKNLAKTTFPVFLDEGDHVFNEDILTSLLKHSVQGLYSREVTDTDINKLVREPALAPLGFSANNNFDDTEKGGLTNRVIIMPFHTRDILTEKRKEQFEKEFTTYYTPDDKRHPLKWIGYEYQARIMEDPKVYRHTPPDEVVKQFFEDICTKCNYPNLLKWINNDITTRTAEDDLKERHETLKDILKTILNKHMEFTIIRDDEMSLTRTPIIDDNLTWEQKIIHLAESQKVSWLRTTKSQDRLIITNGVIRAIHKEDKTININTLEEFRDILQSGKYGVYDVGRYKVNENGTRKNVYNSLRVDVEVISDLYELED